MTNKHPDNFFFIKNLPPVTVLYYPPATNTTDNMKVALALLTNLAAVSANALTRQEEEVSGHTRFVETQ